MLGKVKNDFVLHDVVDGKLAGKFTRFASVLFEGYYFEGTW